MEEGKEKKGYFLLPFKEISLLKLQYKSAADCPSELSHAPRNSVVQKKPSHQLCALQQHLPGLSFHYNATAAFLQPFP